VDVGIRLGRRPVRDATIGPTPALEGEVDHPPPFVRGTVDPEIDDVLSHRWSGELASEYAARENCAAHKKREVGWVIREGHKAGRDAPSPASKSANRHLSADDIVIQ
jgi:hypothetical protein